MNRGARVLAGCAALALPPGCASVDAPPDDLARSELVLPPAFASAPARDAPVRDDWLMDFGDPQLLLLVEEAEAENPDLEAAAARWQEARARLKIAGSLQAPQVDAVALAERSDQGLGAEHRYEVGLRAGWEADLWGRLRSIEAAAEETERAFAFDLEHARQSLAAAVAEAWFRAITARELLAISRDLIEAERFTARVTRDKIDVGAASRLDAEVAEANLALAEDAEQASLAALLESQKALEVLLGRYPAAEAEVAAELPAVPPPPALGFPSELLERRPDVAAADRLVASAFHAAGAARAARLPSVVLTGSLGALLDPTESIWSLGANLLAPLVTGGRLEGEIEVADAAQRQALANYVAVALTAFREVESALANEEVLAVRERQLAQAEQHLRSASAIAQDRYEAGIIGILDLTQVRRQDYQTRSQHLAVRAERLQQRINLYLALGGSFDRPEERE